MSPVITLCVLFAYYVPYIISLRGDGMLVHRVRLGSSVDKRLDEELRELSKQTRIPISKLLDEAIEDLLKKHSAEK